MDQNEQIRDLIADKAALEEMYSQCLPQLHAVKKELILNKGNIESLLKQNSELLQKIDELTKEKESLQNSLQVLQSDSQNGC